MKKSHTDCCVCGKSNLHKDEIGICKKLLGKQITKFYCIRCFAEYLGTETTDIYDKIEQFKEDGCQLFI